MPTLEQVFEKNQDIVKIVYKHYPLKMHDQALNAAVASVIAHEKGKFWEFHDALFKVYNQLSEDKILEVASEVGLNLGQIRNAWKSERVYRKILKDVTDGKKAGVSGVPKIFINGRILNSRSVQAFQQMIEQEFQRLTEKSN